MTKTEIDRAIRRIAVLTREVSQHEWELANTLAAFSPLEYEQALPRIVSETGWTRQRLTALRMTGKQWPVEKRLKDVPFSLHQQYRYKPEELRLHHRTGTLGQPTPAKRRQQWTLTQMQAGIRSILDILDDPAVTDAAFRAKVADILMIWQVARAA